MTEISNTQTFHQKLLAVQKQAQALNLSAQATGQVGTRNYKYLTIQKLHAAVLPILHEHGLTWICTPTHNEVGAPLLAYSLSDGECSINDAMPLVGCDNMQKLGSAISYARRYALLAVLGLTPDEDDDGAKASAKTETRQSVPKIPRDRAVKIKGQAEDAGLWPNGAPAPALKACIVGVGVESGKINQLNVDQAEDVEAWIANEADVEGKS